MPTLSQIYPTYGEAVRVMNNLEAVGVPATAITLVSGEKGAGSRTSAGKAAADTRAYAEGISRGGTLVSVRADDTQAGIVEAILHIQPAGQDAAETVREDPAARAASPPDPAPGDVPARAAPAGAFEERVFEVRATGEEAVVSKEARVVEEIVLRKETGDRVEIVRDTLRETKVEIEDSTTSTTQPGSMPGR